MTPTTETALLQRIDALTKAVQHLAQTQGARLNKAQLAQRLGCHRNTLRARGSQRVSDAVRGW